MSELRDLLQTVDKQREDIDRLTKDILAFAEYNGILNQRISIAHEDIIELREVLAQVVKNMGFDIQKLARDSSCRVKL
jgi:hypothetical protein